MQNKKVVVGMSGGVDSSVAAYLLKKQGYDVTGVTMKVYDFVSGSEVGSGWQRDSMRGTESIKGAEYGKPKGNREHERDGMGETEKGRDTDGKPGTGSMQQVQYGNQVEEKWQAGNIRQALQYTGSRNQEEREQNQEDGGCCGLSAVEDARQVAWKLNIPHYVMNFRQEFKTHVIDYFIDEYIHGRTPNPCIACNRFVKWESLLNRSLEIGADFIATGHYAQIDRLPNGRYALKKSVTEAKDQTYALYNLTQSQLAHTLMPVGQYEKNQIRQIAKEIGISVAHKPDSQEICFIPDHDYAKFIEEHIACQLPEGNFVDVHGNILGRHKGITHYTVGQRKGLNLSLGRPVFVMAIRPESNEVVIGEAGDVFSNRLTCSHLNWMAIDGLKEGAMRVQAKIRYSHKGAPCVIEEIGPDLVEVRFEEPQRAITPGQAVVFYDGGYVVGGGTIR